MKIKLFLIILLNYLFIYKCEGPDAGSWQKSLEDPSFEEEDYDPESKPTYTTIVRPGPSRIRVCDKSQEVIICECIPGGNQTLKCGAQNLRNANLIIPKEIGPIAIAHLERNSISYLFKNKIMPGQEKSLLVLDLSQNKIEDIEPGSFDNFENLLDLKLTQNNLNELSDDIFTKFLGSLHQLYLDYNYLSKLDDGVFDNLKNLKKLVLDGNRELKLTKNVLTSSLSKLEILSLDRCQLEKLDDDLFENIPNLRALSLSGNPLRTIPNAISKNKLPKLEILVMSDTYLEVLNKSELNKVSPTLKKLYMRKNRYLKKIDNCAFCGFKQLESLDFSDSKSLNELDSNSFGKSPPKELKQIDIKNCNFSTLHEGTLKNVYWSTMQRLRLEGNPWNCNCQLKWLMENENAMRTAADFESPKCKTPENVKGLNLYDAQNQLECGGVPIKGTSSMAKTMVFMIIMMLSAVIFIFGFLYARKHFTLTGRPAHDQIGFSVGREMFSDEFEEENEEGTEVIEPANTIIAVGNGVPRPEFV